MMTFALGTEEDNNQIYLSSTALPLVHVWWCSIFWLRSILLVSSRLALRTTSTLGGIRTDVSTRLRRIINDSFACC